MNNEDLLRIDTAELRRACESVIAHLEEVAGKQISLESDYFWSVPNPDRYAVYVKPDLTIGQASEAWENLRRERGGDDESTVAFAAVWLGDILTTIGHSVPG